MKRIILAAALAVAPAVALVGGCEESGSSSMKMNTPWKKTAPPAPPAVANYFEVKKSGKTYVLGSAESLKAFNEGNESALTLKEVPGYGPKGVAVVFEQTTYTDTNRMMAEYKKNHP